VGIVGTINTIDPRGGSAEGADLLSRQPGTRRSLGLVIRTPLDPTVLVPQVGAAVATIDPEQPIYDVRTMEQWAP
jgi:hypothetical protein